MPSINLTSTQELVLRPALDIDKYKKLVLNSKTGRTDHKLVGKYDKGRNIRRRLVEVADSMTDLKVKKVRKAPKLTSGKVDKGIVTEEAFGKLADKVDDLAAAMALLAKVIADKA